MAPTAKDLLAQGWTVEKASLYDEEGVDGWMWTSPNGQEFCEMGDWDKEPPIPEHLARKDANTKNDTKEA